MTTDISEGCALRDETDTGASARPAGDRARKRLLLGLGLALVGVALVVLARPALDNIHVVVPGTVFRSAQLSPQRLDALIATHHLNAVLNLRGPSPGAAWYDDEVATTARLGVRHIDFKLSAVREVPVPVAEQLVHLLEQLPMPLLIHCQAGADRTGLASALYRYAIVGTDADEAADQLSVLYGHVPFFRSGTAAMDRSFWEYVRAHPQTLPRSSVE